MLQRGHVVDDGAPAEVTRRYERMYQDAGDDRPARPIASIRRPTITSAASSCAMPPARSRAHFDAGEVMEIHLWSSGRAPENSYTVEFKLFNSDDQVISFGAANPGPRHLLPRRAAAFRLPSRTAAADGRARTRSASRLASGTRSGGTSGRRRSASPSADAICSAPATASPNVNDGDFVIPQEWLTGD